MSEWTEGPFTIRQYGARFQVYHEGQLRLAALGDELAALCDVVMQAEMARQEQVVSRDRTLLGSLGYWKWCELPEDKQVIDGEQEQ